MCVSGGGGEGGGGLGLNFVLHPLRDSGPMVHTQGGGVGLYLWARELNAMHVAEIIKVSGQNKPSKVCPIMIYVHAICAACTIHKLPSNLHPGPESQIEFEYIYSILSIGEGCETLTVTSTGTSTNVRSIPS